MSNEDGVPLDRVVRAYINIRTAKRELGERYREEDHALDEQLNKAKNTLLQHCKDSKTKGGTTEDGHTFSRTVKTRYVTQDWVAFNKVILEHKVPELYEKRIHQGNMKQFLTENPDVLPAGLRADSEYTIVVRRGKNEPK
tara:strand:+ start:665 stop:1084 length:420 start_codon:yes stop_codon:yes gene_type:complete